MDTLSNIPNSTKELNTPILFLIFNRPDTTKQVFDVIRKVKPKKFYIASDGPRIEKNAEDQLVSEVRTIVSNIDWECEVKTLFQEKNKGCKNAVSEAITWFFSHEEYGIILEDDCLPDISFFHFCQTLLIKYKDYDNIMSICGTNINEKLSTDKSFYFSNYPLMWGWATWSRAWSKYDVKMLNYPKFKSNNGLHNLKMGGYPFVKAWNYIFQQTYLGQIDTWDYQWIFCCWNNKGITIAPNKNLVKNIGFSDNATHTKISDPIRSNLKSSKADDILTYPNNFEINYKADEYLTKFWFHISWLNLLKSQILKFSLISNLNYYKNKIFRK